MYQSSNIKTDKSQILVVCRNIVTIDQLVMLNKESRGYVLKATIHWWQRNGPWWKNSRIIIVHLNVHLVWRAQMNMNVLWSLNIRHIARHEHRSRDPFTQELRSRRTDSSL